MDIQIEFSAITCYSCGFAFAVPAGVKKSWIEKHTTFYCPSCQSSQWFPGESDREKYERLYNEKLRCCISLQEEAAYQRSRANGMKGALIKTQKKLQSRIQVDSENFEPQHRGHPDFI